MFSSKEIIKIFEVALVSFHCYCLIGCIMIARWYRHWNTANTTTNICLLVKNGNRNTKTLVRHKIHREVRNEVRSQSPTQRIGRIPAGNLPILIVIWYPTVSLPESVPERIDYRLASFFSISCRSFSLTLNTIHTISQCYSSNFKHVNVGWEVLR